ncbi:MAG: DUF1232 domain-containing protein [Chlorobium sp.]|nr:MAG: DUF1232 domain-containing protein [Chlorobium sp.]
MKKTFSKRKRKAETVIESPRKTKKLVDAAIKLSSSKQYSSHISAIARKIPPLARMARSYATREYLDIPWQSIVLVTIALIYFVSPFDAIPDLIPFLGFTDDLAIITAVFSAIIQDVDKFIAWETAKSSAAETVDYTVLDSSQK